MHGENIPFLEFLFRSSCTMMEVGRSLVSSPAQFLARPHLRNCTSSSSPVVLVHDQVTPSLSSLSATSLARSPPTSILIQDQRNEGRQLTSLKEDSAFQRLDVKQALIEPTSSSSDRTNYVDPNQDENKFQLQLLSSPELYLWPSLHRDAQSVTIGTDTSSGTSEKSVVEEADRVLALAREAFSASIEATSILKDARLFETHRDEFACSRDLSCVSVKRIVRSTHLMTRKTKRRRTPKLNVDIEEIKYHVKTKLHRQNGERFDANDPFRLFLRGPETTKLLTAKEESGLIMKIQALMKIQEVKNRLQTQFSREPTVVELASAVGISCLALQSQIQTGENSREKLIYANFRMVVHIAKQYQGRGLNILDLFQEGSLGLMKSVEKFKPQVGCRFATYAYWWIRQSIRKALFQHSRTIRLPENVHSKLSKVYEAKRACIQQGNSHPKKEEIAASAGMSLDKLETLLNAARMPLSLQQPVWMDQDTTLQEITADTTIEAPDVGAAKQLMRQHARNLLSVLNPRERKIIRLRFGIDGGKEKSLSEIGAGFGLSKERIRQLENRALHKLKQCLSSQGLAAYSDLLI